MAKEMTERDWLEGANAASMVSFAFTRRTGDRKLRLFGCACCRRVWDRLPDDASREAVGVAERYADKLAKRTDLNRAYLACGGDTSPSPNNAAATVVKVSLKMAAFWTSYNARCMAAGTGPIMASQIAEHTAASNREGQGQVPLLRDIFGNPFHPVAIDPAWLTPNVVDLAGTIYEERALPSGELDRTRLAVLADALMDAGCDNAEILEHCRGEGPHVRGCWVVDLILGKE